MVFVKETASRLILTGTREELETLSNAYRVRPPEYWRSPKWELYKQTKGERGWDGYIYPLKVRGHTGILARGHLEDLKERALASDIALDLAGCLRRPYEGMVLDDVPTDLVKSEHPDYPHQREIVWQWLRHCVGIGEITVSGGKCLGRGTPILMHDGTTKPVEDVQVGDQLMGPDSLPRTVLSTAKGHAELFRIDQGYGDSYVTNGDHILVLQSLGDPRRKDYTLVREMTTNAFREMTRSQKTVWHGIKSAVEFKKQDVPLDPYWLGLWLGDGNFYDSEIAVGDGDTEIAEFCREHASAVGMDIRLNPGSGCSGFRFCTKVQGWNANTLRSALDSLGLLKRRKAHLGSKENPRFRFIPLKYMVNDRDTRLKLLAGLIDSDGSVDRNGSRAVVTTVYLKLAQDTVWLARSLGFKASYWQRKTGIKSRNFVGSCFVVSIAGERVGDIPTRLSRKKLKSFDGSTTGSKRSTSSQIKVTPIGPGDYFGFEIDGDRRFLLGDFTVTHNTRSFCMAASMLSRKLKKIRVLYLVPTERLVKQAYSDACGFLPDWKISQFGGNKRDKDGDLVVATYAIISRNMGELDEWLKTFNVLFVDEAHHASSPTLTKIIESVPAYFKFGATDSAKEDDPIKGLAIRGLLGPVLARVEAGELIEDGHLAKPTIYIVDEPSWQNKFADVPHQAEPDSKAWVYMASEWKQGTYLGPSVERLEDGTPRLDKKGNEIQLPSSHRVEIKGMELDVESRWCLLDRVYDRGIIRFKERNELVYRWASHFSNTQERTLVIATRTLHVLLLQAGLEKVVDPKLVKILFSENDTVERDETFAWLKETPGSILVSPLVKEGVSLPELTAGVVADYVGSVDLARQIIGRFIRKKRHREENAAKIVWFVDRQIPSYRRGSLDLLRSLESIRGYSFVHPVQGPETMDLGLRYEGRS